MRLLVRSLDSPVPQTVQADPEGSLSDLLEVLASGTKLPEGFRERPRLVYHGRVLRDSGAKLRDVCSEGDVLVLLAGRHVTPPPSAPAQPPKGPSLRDINAAIREDLSRLGPGQLAAAEAAARRQARQARRAQGPPSDMAELLSQALVSGEVSALRSYLEQLQAALRAAGGGGGAGPGGGDAALPAAAALEALFGLAGQQPGGGGEGAAAALGQEVHAEGLDELEAEEEGEFSHTEEEGSEAEEDSEEDGEGHSEEGEEEEEEGSEEEGEHQLGADGQLLPPQVPDLDSRSLAALMDMGFPEALCRNALLWGRNRFDPALDWLLGHAEDPDAAVPLSDSLLARLYGRGPARQGAAADQAHLAHLTDMGFERLQAEQALRTFNNSLPAAASWLLTLGTAASAAPAPAQGAGAAAAAGPAAAAAAGGGSGAGPSRQQRGEAPSEAGWPAERLGPAGGRSGEEGEEEGDGGGSSSSGSQVDGDPPGLVGDGGSGPGDGREGAQQPQRQQHQQQQEEEAMPHLQQADEDSEGEEAGERAHPLGPADDEEAAPGLESDHGSDSEEEPPALQPY